MKKIIALSILSSLLLIAGCAGNPRVGQHGENLVWIQSIQVIGGDSNALYLPSQGGIAGALVANTVGLVSNKANEGKIHIAYSPDGSRAGTILFRKPWVGASDLQPHTWAILSKDADGRILLPCGGCEPVSAQN